jgi:hypothetical protein
MEKINSFHNNSLALTTKQLGSSSSFVSLVRSSFIRCGRRRQ